MAYTTITRLIFLILWGFLMVTMWFFGRFSPVEQFKEQQIRINEVLEFPWDASPLPVTGYEKEIIQDLKLDAPLFSRDIRPWRSFDGLFAFRGAQEDEQNERMKQALEFMDDFKDFAGQTQERAQLFSKARKLIKSCYSQDRDSWVVAYNLGVCYLWNGERRGALDYLKDAEGILSRQEENWRNQQSNSAHSDAFWEAWILTQYALGEASFSDKDTRENGLVHYRQAVQSIFNLANEFARTIDDPYGHVTNGFMFFQLSQSEVNTVSLWSDLVAAYMTFVDYHWAEEEKTPLKPEEAPRCEYAFDKQLKIKLNYRDRIFCKSLHRTQDPFKSSFVRLFEQFYTGDSYDQEYLLWALSNLIDIRVDNPDIEQYPLIMYNAAQIQLRLGEFIQASDMIMNAYESPFFFELAEQENTMLLILNEENVSDKIKKLAIVAGILVGEKPDKRFCPPSNRPSSTFRKKFDQLYGEDMDIFPAVGACFKNPNDEREVDKWLFIQLWRRYLNRGDFTGFETEYQKAGGSVSMGFFQNWRRDTFQNIGLRAHQKYLTYLDREDEDTALLIRRFVLRSGLFDQETQALFKVELGDRFFASLPWLLRGGLVVFALLLLVIWHPIHRSARRSFLGMHRVSRLKGSRKKHTLSKSGSVSSGVS
ncbi:tetratricopeptide repeat protein [Acanthopleuribacter pedis]|uniref:Tetratricopeptide repeat protein n=1 Tax=Acanthopleuribacter pedis TaxID=442870 RepID=A0A8J7U4F2_9BACT|nr:hypothetical protein [Acanthopleuribacter pedis]MBO1319739.1 hypothetical protein [Acanthopleuribacter pedis]